MTKKPSTKSSASRRPPKPPKKTGIGLSPGGHGGRFKNPFPTAEGAISSYVHEGGRVGAMIELSCDTGSNARTEDFLRLAKELCLQVTATKPLYVTRDSVPGHVLSSKLKEFKREAAKGNRTPAEVLKIIESKWDDYFSSVCLLEQRYIRETLRDVKVKDLLHAVRVKLDTTIAVRYFIRFEVGKECTFGKYP